MSFPADGICVSHVEVGAAWIDAGGQIQRAWYLKAFDDAGEALTRLAGMGEAYTQATQNSWVALESHLAFHEPVMTGETVRIESWFAALDANKIHVCQAMLRERTLLATHEQLGLHFNTGTRRSTPFAEDILVRLRALQTARAQLPPPSWLGGRIVLA